MGNSTLLVKCELPEGYKSRPTKEYNDTQRVALKRKLLGQAVRIQASCLDIRKLNMCVADRRLLTQCVHEYK